ncbi:MAG: aminoacyl-tRNA hydrolase, partial [Ignavibacteriales bacterium]|nr:aminoacyl-tRNA hydrolase [Ignavibacteriales bacterium]
LLFHLKADRILEIVPGLSISLSEIRFRTSRSSGPGGQNVNKLETRVELLFDVVHSPSLTDEQRALIARYATHRLDRDGVLHISSQKYRSQYQNKEAAVGRLQEVLHAALKPRQHRVATKRSITSSLKRLDSKRLHSVKKKLRRRASHAED